MYYKCIIELNGDRFNTNQDLTNWDEIETDYKRKDMEGAIRSFSSKFSFAGETCRRLYSAFKVTGLNTIGKITIYLLTKNTLEWYEYFSCDLDFSSMSYDGYRFELSAFDNSIANLLSSKKSTKYEYLVNSMAKETVHYDRIRMNNWGKSVLAPITNDDSIGGKPSEYMLFKSSWNTIPLYFEDSSIPVKGSVELYDQQQEYIEWNEKNTYTRPSDKNAEGKRWAHFLKAKKNVSVRLKMGFKATASITVSQPDIYEPDSELKVGLFVFNDNGYARTVLVKDMERKQTIVGISGDIDFFIDTTISMSAGESLSLMLRTPYNIAYVGGSSTESSLTFAGYDESMYCKGENWSARVDWQDIGQPVTFDGIRPLTLLKNIVSSICGENVGVRIDAEGNERLQKCILCAAESIRVLEQAKIYTTFAQFCNFMEALFGYIYTIEDGVVIFKSRDRLFSNQFTKVLSECTDFKLSVDTSMIYSAIEVGNQKVDYDEDNGLYEYNFRQTFSTGRDYGQNVLSLSPDYRVDCYGVEYLTEKREDNTKDSDSDTDIFAIMLNSANKPDTSVQVKYREYVGFIYRDTIVQGMFNVLYHPRYCIEANRQYLATFADTLKYASSDGNSSVLFGEKAITGDVTLDEKKYTPYQVSCKSSDISLPSDKNGAVRLTRGGVEYNGWIASLKLYPTKSRSSSYQLILADDSYTFEEPTPEPTERVTINVEALNVITVNSSTQEMEITRTFLDISADSPLAYDILLEVLLDNIKTGDDRVYNISLSAGTQNTRHDVAIGYSSIRSISIEQQDEDNTDYVIIY